MEYFDAHAHYDDEQFDEDRDELIKAMHDFGVTKIVCNGYSLQGSFDAYELQRNMILYIQLLEFHLMI